jgi:membrane protein
MLRQAIERVRSYLEQGPLRRILLSLAQGMARHHAGRTASAMAFNLFLATIPMLALAGWLLTVVLHRDAESLTAASTLLELTPTDVRQIFDRHFGRFSVHAVAPIAVLGSVWLASSAFHTLMSVFETALYAERRSWYKKRLIALGCVAVAIPALGFNGSVAVMLSSGSSRIVETLLGVPTENVLSGRLIAAAAAVGTLTALFAGFYYVAVKRPDVRRRVWPGAVVTVIIGSLASSALGYYGSTVAKFTLFYGGLATVAVALAWLWLWCAAMLLGAELNAQLENRDLGKPLVSRNSIP